MLMIPYIAAGRLMDFNLWYLTIHAKISWLTALQIMRHSSHHDNLSRFLINISESCLQLFNSSQYLLILLLMCTSSHRFLWLGHNQPQHECRRDFSADSLRSLGELGPTPRVPHRERVENCITCPTSSDWIWASKLHRHGRDWRKLFHVDSRPDWTWAFTWCNLPSLSVRLSIPF